MRLLLLWASNRLSFATGADLSINIYNRTLYQPYAVHCARNSSEVIAGISNKTGDAIYIIMSILNLLSTSVMMIAILIALLSVDPAIALAAFGGFGLIYTAFIIVNFRGSLSLCCYLLHDILITASTQNSAVTQFHDLCAVC